MEIICYGCGRGEYPENTIEAIAHCQKINLNWRIDVDLQLTKDHEIVLFHDDNVLKKTGVNATISTLTLQEVQKLNAGYHFKKENEYPYRNHPLQIPTLQDTFKTFPKATYILDIHTHNLKAIAIIIKIIEQYAMEKQVIIVSQYDDVITWCKEKRPKWRYGAATKEVKKMVFSSFVFLDFLFPITSDVLLIPQKFNGITLLTKRVIQHIKKRKKKLIVWKQEGKTNDDVVCIETLQEYIEIKSKGIDAVYTEYPERFSLRINYNDALKKIL